MSVESPDNREEIRRLILRSEEMTRLDYNDLSLSGRPRRDIDKSVEALSNARKSVLSAILAENAEQG